MERVSERRAAAVFRPGDQWIVCDFVLVPVSMRKMARCIANYAPAETLLGSPLRDLASYRGLLCRLPLSADHSLRLAAPG
jgi:hypothetical protein